MKLGNTRLGRIAGVAALGVGLMVTAASCGEDLKEAACTDYECAPSGVLEGNAAISGVASLDAFFGSVVNFGKVAVGVTADIDAQLSELQVAFGISNAQLKAAGSLDAAIKAKLENELKAELVVEAQPAKCEVQASVQVEATAKCQAEAGCDVSGGEVNVQCMGSCTVEASAEGSCEGDVQATCEFSGPELSCEGECKGSCVLEGEAALDCKGTCNGTCNGTCSVENTDGSCAGSCDGQCMGSCEVGGMLALQCEGKCNGSCKAKAPEGGCQADAKVTCEFDASANASCTGKCDGEIIPPKVECEASASCEASAKADAKFAAQCTPPSVKVDFRLMADVDADVSARLQFLKGKLQVILPNLLAAIKKAEFVADAGLQLGEDGKNAIRGSLKGLANGELSALSVWRLTAGNCVIPQIEASAKLVGDVSKSLTAKVAAAGKVTAAIGLNGG